MLYHDQGDGINRKIPLPADSDKKLKRVQEDAIALVVVKHIKLP